MFQNQMKSPKLYSTLSIIFLFSTLFWVIQHASRSNPWDFHVYVMNGEHWFQNGSFFEPMRPPLMALFTGILSWVSRPFAEYGYLVFTSVLFAYSTASLARTLKVNATELYIMLCSSFLLSAGLTEGTELLQFSFLELYLISILNGGRAGLLLGLVFLSRYTGLAYLPLLLFDRKNLFKNLGWFLVSLLPWLFYNHFKYGSSLASFSDLYANNILFRDEIKTPFQISHFVQLGGIILPFAFAGAVVSVTKKPAVHKQFLLIQLSLVVLTLFAYSRIPLKESRHLFNLLLPISFFALVGIQYLTCRIHQNNRAALILIVFIANLMIASSTLDDGRETQKIYAQARNDIQTLHLDHCSTQSNGWVELSYEGQFSKPVSCEKLLSNEMEQGEVVVAFHWIQDPPFLQNLKWLSAHPAVKETRAYSIFGKGCKPQEPSSGLYLRRRAQEVFKTRGIIIEERPCYLFFQNEWLRNICDWCQ